MQQNLLTVENVLINFHLTPGQTWRLACVSTPFTSLRVFHVVFQVFNLTEQGREHSRQVIPYFAFTVSNELPIRSEFI